MRQRYCSHAMIEERLKDRRERLALYKAREREILDKNGVKSYTIGPRSLTRYDTSLKDVLDTIRQLEDEIAELEGMRCGCKPRRAVGVVPRDDW